MSEDELVIGPDELEAADGALQDELDLKPAEQDDEKIVIKKKRPMPRYQKEKLLLRPGLPNVKTSFPRKKYVGTNVSSTVKLRKRNFGS